VERKVVVTMELQIFVCTVLLCFIGVVGVTSLEESDRLIEVGNLGKIYGRIVQTYPNSTDPDAPRAQYLEFRGIPYAYPPLEDARFLV